MGIKKILPAGSNTPQEGAENIVFIHGWASTPEVWHNQQEYFSKNYKVILPNISRAENIKEASAIVYNAIKDKEDFVLIGWSLGWLAILELLESQSLKPKGLVCVSSTARFTRLETTEQPDAGYGLRNSLLGSPRAARSAQRVPKKMGFNDDGYPGTGPTNTHLAKMIRDCKRNPKKVIDDFYKSMLTDIEKSALSEFRFKNLDYHKLIYGLGMLRDCDYRDFISQIDAPVLIIVGSKDKITPPEASEYIHKKIKDSELKLLDCGHLPFLNKTDEFNLLVENFVKGL